jgi:hypothetical protein
MARLLTLGSLEIQTLCFANKPSYIGLPNPSSSTRITQHGTWIESHQMKRKGKPILWA